MGKNSAEYMRAYRARRKLKAGLEAAASQPPEEALIEARRVASGYAALSNDQRRQIEELEEEVRYLKAELARKPAVLLHADRKTQQAERDRILGRVNRGG